MSWVKKLISKESWLFIDFAYSLGASAGAGSGEFDIYRGCRRRQIIREAFLHREAKEVGG